MTSIHWFCMIWNVGLRWSHCRGNGLHLELISGTPSDFAFLRCHQCSSLLGKVFLGMLGSSIKQIASDYEFDGEHGIALRTMQGNRASPQGEFKVSWVFSSCSRNLGYILELIVGMAIRNSSLFSDVRTPV